MIDQQGLNALIASEETRFIQSNPRAQALAAQAAQHWHNGVPFHWMLDWGTPFPLVVEQAQGATLTSVDGQQFDDFCLADTGAMFGHSPPAVAAALRHQASRGLGYMLPGEDTLKVGALLHKSFGMPYWQVTTTASEANRAVIRWCRGITGRRKILIFNGCYHGAVDDVFVDLQDGAPRLRPSLIGQVADPRQDTIVIEFNDLPALQAALHTGDIACVLAEPVMTNVGMVLPDPGYWAAASNMIRAAGTLLIFDETHCISSGPSGESGRIGIAPDLFVIGKAIAGGVPAAAYGFSADVAAAMDRVQRDRPPGHSGIGTTLSANALAMAAMRAMLEQVITPENYAQMLPLADRLVAGLRDVIARHHLDWHVAHVGARVEFICTPRPPRNGTEARAAMQGQLEHFIHLYLINRGLLLAPFHNMALISPATTAAQVDRLISGVGGLAAALSGI